MAQNQADYITSQYLEEIQTNIRVRPIPWEGYVRASVLSANEASLMKSIEKQNREKRAEIVEKSATRYAEAIIDLLDRISRDDVVKYILSLAGDFVVDVEEFGSTLLNDQNAGKIFNILVKLLERNDEQIYLLAAKTLVVLLSLQPGPPQHVTSLFLFLATKLASSPNVNLQDFAVQGFGVLLRSKPYRQPFWNHKDTVVPPLVKILSNTSGSKGVGGIQLQYYSLLVFWLITFEKPIATEVVTKFNIVPKLLEIARNAVKEKIIRISIATLVNLVKISPRMSIPVLISQSALPFVKTLSDRKWADEELIEDLQTLKDVLQERFQSMSTFDEYKSEIVSKKLQWSPPHRSETFWKENVYKFKDHDWQVLKQLSSIYNIENADNITLAVACNDINRIVNELPDSIKVLEKDNTKLKIMELMKHSDAEVRYEALKATQSFISRSFKN